MGNTRRSLLRMLGQHPRSDRDEGKTEKLNAGVKSGSENLPSRAGRSAQTRLRQPFNGREVFAHRSILRGDENPACCRLETFACGPAIRVCCGLPAFLSRLEP